MLSLFHYSFMRFTSCLPLVSSVVSLLLSQIQRGWQKIEIAWHEKLLLVIHAVLNWHGSIIASIRSQYNDKYAHRRCTGYGITVWGLRRCNSYITVWHHARKPSDFKGPMLWQVRQGKTDISICEKVGQCSSNARVVQVDKWMTRTWLAHSSAHSAMWAKALPLKGVKKELGQQALVPWTILDPLKRRKTTSKTGETSKHCEQKQERKKNWLRRYVLKISKEFDRKVLEAYPSYFFKALPSRTVC